MIINYPRKRPEMMVSWKWFNNMKEKRVYSKIKSRQGVLCFVFDCGRVKIYVSFIELIWGYYVFAGLNFKVFSYIIQDPFKQDLYNIAYAYMV